MRASWTNTIASRQPQSGKHSRFGLGLDDLAPAVKTVWADVMTQMHFTRGRFDRNWRLLKMLVRAMHAAFGRRFLVLLDGHGATPYENRKIVHVQSLTPDGYLSFLRLARTTKGSVRPGKSIGWTSSPATTMGWGQTSCMGTSGSASSIWSSTIA